MERIMRYFFLISISLCIVVLLTIISCQYNSDQNKLPYKVLLKRFSDFSSGPALITVKLKSPSYKEMCIIIENPEWRSILKRDIGMNINNKQYTKYMMENYTNVFLVSDKLYKSLINKKAIILPKHINDKKKGRTYLIKKYMKKTSYSNHFTDEFHDLYNVEFDNEFGNRDEQYSLMRVFIEEGFDAVRDCYGGCWSVDAKLKTK